MGKHDATITKRIRNFMVVEIDGTPFEVKVYDIPPELGIDNERTCRLEVLRDKDNGKIIAYQQGWVKYPAKKHEDKIRTLLQFCNDLPPVNEWRSDSQIITNEEEK